MAGGTKTRSRVIYDSNRNAQVDENGNVKTIGVGRQVSVGQRNGSARITGMARDRRSQERQENRQRQGLVSNVLSESGLSASTQKELRDLGKGLPLGTRVATVKNMAKTIRQIQEAQENGNNAQAEKLRSDLMGRASRLLSSEDNARLNRVIGG